MSDEQDPHEEEAAQPDPRSLRLGGHTLADHILQRAILHHTLAENEQLRAEQAERKPTWKEVYERYRRRHAKDSTVTIREVCEELEVDYDNIRAAKSRATKREKRHNKRHKRSS